MPSRVNQGEHVTISTSPAWAFPGQFITYPISKELQTLGQRQEFQCHKISIFSWRKLFSQTDMLTSVSTAQAYSTPSPHLPITAFLPIKASPVQQCLSGAWKTHWSINMLCNTERILLPDGNSSVSFTLCWHQWMVATVSIPFFSFNMKQAASATTMFGLVPISCVKYKLCFYDFCKSTFYTLFL